MESAGQYLFSRAHTLQDETGIVGSSRVTKSKTESSSSYQNGLLGQEISPSEAKMEGRPKKLEIP